ncbi:MAG: hypothetical protein M5U28_52840 [Sandaracinaceae bacterium]|nr:hypothetical protein [Sandaracinaceae bacterium]
MLLNRRALRLMYAPHGEAAGHIDFRVADMADVGGRPLLDALVLLLGRDRLFGVAADRQLHSLLARSRQMQADVTTALSGQVFFALETLLRGFEAADARAGGEWLRPVLEQSGDGERDVLFDALLTVLLRLVFLLYAEDTGLLPTEHPLYQKHYSLYALFARLEAERAQHPDAMSRRYSAWPGLLALFRVVYLGASHGDLVLPRARATSSTRTASPSSRASRPTPRPSPCAAPTRARARRRRSPPSTTRPSTESCARSSI